MYILTDGKNYVTENPMKRGVFISTTYPVKAKKFTYKQARSLLQNKNKKMSWIKNYHMLNEETGEINKEAKNTVGNGGVFLGKNSIDFNYGIVNEIITEVKSIIGLAAWSEIQLRTYEQELENALSMYDSGISDVEHALQKYKEDNNGKKTQAHKVAKLGYLLLLDEIRDKRKNVKQCMNYIKVLEDAFEHGYTLEKLKLELTKAKYVDYKGRTEYWQKR